MTKATLVARVDTACNLTVSELDHVNQLAHGINLLVENGNFTSLDVVEQFLRLLLPNWVGFGVIADVADWHIYRGGRHIALSRIGGTNGTTERVLLVAEVDPTSEVGKRAAQLAASGAASDAALQALGLTQTEQQARVAAYIDTLSTRQHKSYAAAYAHQVDAVGLDDALDHLADYSYGLTSAARTEVRRGVLAARLLPKATVVDTAAALKACTGAVSVTVTDGAQTATVPAPEPPQATTAPVVDLPPVSATVNPYGFTAYFRTGHQQLTEAERARIAATAEQINDGAYAGKFADLSYVVRDLRTDFPGWSITRGPGWVKLARSTSFAEALHISQPLTAAQAGVEPGDAHDVYINQGLREGWVLATIDRQYLVEYTMPKGTTALLVGTVGASTMKSVSYTAVSRKWLQAIVDAGSVWEGKAQSIYRAPNKHGYGGNNQTVPSAEQLLAAKGQK